MSTFGTRIILAHFSRPKIIYSIFSNGFLLALLICIALFSDHGHFIANVYERHDIYFPALVLALLCIVYYLFFEFLTIWQFVFDRSRALWIKNGVLIYLNRFFLSENCDGIQAISVGKYGRRDRPAIFLVLRNGRKRLVPSGALQEDQSKIVDKLKAELRLRN